ncbi:hypothetical protein [Acidisoma sp. C75]
MNTIQQETLAALVERHAGEHDLPRHVLRIGFGEALSRGDDPLHILQYLKDVGVAVATLEQLFEVVSDPGEEDMEAFRVEDGVAVYLAVDGQWLLFTR